MFTKLLVANRGEIAVRVVRACRDLGISPVAIYSDLDAEAPHVRLADEAHNVGPGPASASYLDIAAIMAAARRSGAQAVHPGYGFLAENAGFARAVADAGMAWVGPPAEVIAAMGDKTAARRSAVDAGVPTVPGTMSPVRDPAEVAAFAEEHGLPVAIKAAAGGGGKGFRVVRRRDEIEDALAGAAREAQAFFSSPDVYLERYLERPRHVEVQVVGDASGAVLSFPERDCSLQRRHQKLVEESPSPRLHPAVREAIMEAAARISKQVGYRNAGTCEFLLADDGVSFFFLEMNTRLQVEHPVTELVTGVDLVRAQLLVAAEEPLDLTQDAIELRGHAIECRINAEDPARRFMPAPGTITTYREPGGPGVRVDSGVEAGSEVSQAYDPLLIKVATHGRDRDEARRRMLRALGELEVGGVVTTAAWHQLMLSDERFVEGRYHTGTVENEMDLSSLAASGDAPGGPPPGRSAPRPRVALRRFGVEVGGKRFDVVAREHLDEAARPRKPSPPAARRALQGGASDALVAPMQGTIVKVLVAEGDEVSAGEVVCVLEAMKMENSILAHVDGTVAELRVAPGEAVETGAPIALIR
ncbi:MAG TPA: acetyl-CoA carboxylase biotin carboxylase subunit [Actinomycetota bacterium]|nr:acetyl-CoA carboxylase biotin carboxylase subunit [Actinomycetota bacterium]